MNSLALRRTPLSAALARWRLASCVVVTGWMLVGAPQAGAVLMDLGSVPNADRAIPVHAISGNGKVIVGSYYGKDAHDYSTAWSAAEGLVDLTQKLKVDYLYARATNADGSVIAGYGTLGYTTGNFDTLAFRWSATDGLTNLGTLGGKFSYAYGISDDGSVIVGEAEIADRTSKAFRWTTAGMQNLGSLNANESSVAYGVSGNGAVVVGRSGSSAFRWEASTGMQNLGTLGGSSKAVATDRTGAVVVGESTVLGTTPATRAFRWTAATGMQDLGTLGGVNSSATDVSADGSIIVGKAEQANNQLHAFRWNLADGMTDLGVLSGETSSQATAVSDDGNTVIGTSGARSFIWSRYGTALQDLDNLEHSQITSAATLGQLTAAQNRRLRDLNQQQCIPTDTQPYCLSGGLGTYRGEGASSGNQVIGQASAGLRISEHFAVGASVNLGQADLKTENAKQSNAYGLALWGAYQQQPDSLGWVANASVGMGHSRNRFERGVGLADVQRAQARTDMNSTGVRLAVGYGVQLGSSRVTPEIALSHARTQSDGFTERNVAFPLTLDAASSDETYATLGVRSETPLNAKTTLHLGAAVDALLNDNTDPIEGHSAVPGMGRFQLRSNLDKRDLLPMANAGVSYALSQSSTVSGQVQVGAATHKDESAVYGLGVQYRYAF